MVELLQQVLVWQPATVEKCLFQQLTHILGGESNTAIEQPSDVISKIIINKLVATVKEYYIPRVTEEADEHETKKMFLSQSRGNPSW